MAAVASPAVLGARHAVAPRRVAPRAQRVTARAARVSTVVRAMARETDPKKRIVITGMGLCSVFGNDYDVFYDKLLAGTSGVAEIDRFDIGEFPTKFAAQIRDFDNEGFVDKKNARRMDDCLQYALVSGNKALLDAGLDEEALAKEDLTKIGVLAGSGMGGLTVFQDGVKALVEKGPKKITPFFIPYAITNMGGALLAIEKGFMGPNYSISTACATANYAFHSAANHIRKGEADVMIAGGVEAPIIPVGLGGFVACRALSTNNDDPAGASRPWDKSRDGFVMGEGAGLLVLESLDHALKRGARIHAEYLGGAITCDAHHMTDPRPDGSGVGLCITKAVEDAGIDISEINYINAHATSTLVGDVAEVNAVKKAFGGVENLAGVKMNGTKSMVGHCLGAAAGVEAVATIMAIKTGWLHPTLNNAEPIDEVAGIDICANEKVEHKVTAAISNSFGFGGHNSCCIFAPYVE
jgi:3-oxoacyl-[acyl-carrier-protein] synthase II